MDLGLCGAPFQVVAGVRFWGFVPLLKRIAAERVGREEVGMLGLLLVLTGNGGPHTVVLWMVDVEPRTRGWTPALPLLAMGTIF